MKRKSQTDRKTENKGTPVAAEEEEKETIKGGDEIGTDHSKELYPIFSTDIRMRTGRGYKAIEKKEKAEVKAKAGSKAKRPGTKVVGRTDRIDTFFIKIKNSNGMGRSEHSENRDILRMKAGQQGQSKSE